MSSSVLTKAQKQRDAHAIGADDDFLPEHEFLRMLRLERKRTDRSRRPFVLMLLESRTLLRSGHQLTLFNSILGALFQTTRETDLKGWYRAGTVIGVIFAEIGAAPDRSVAATLLTKVTRALTGCLSLEQINQLRLSFHVYPEQPSSDGSGAPLNPILYPELTENATPRPRDEIVKRSLDIAGSLTALALLSPIMLAIAVLIKLTSQGPVIFRQTRIGRHGATFTFFKFRSMYVGNDSSVHREFIKALIASGETTQPSEGQNREQATYKLTVDPRITPLGRFLRKTSLDELPQFWNVLMGTMSLVGPRPPIPYEFSCYDLWHRERVLAVRPGITGPWQVDGRSRVKFDDMVRMDLRYARSWSLWGDLKLLLRTPGAVLSGRGAC
jgi:lipopolysaccharide/colanic/teichoic acid biosynthesis glycosyltransferase